MFCTFSHGSLSDRYGCESNRVMFLDASTPKVKHEEKPKANGGTLQKPRFTLGRDPQADIPIADPSVSRIHAELSLVEPDVLFLTDCNSSNGTFLLRGGKETRIHQSKIELSDKVKLGSVVISGADLAAALRRKTPPPSSEPAQKRAEFSASVKLIRCECGAIKRAGSSCPSCTH
jgi:hypothetical protein